MPVLPTNVALTIIETLKKACDKYRNYFPKYIATDTLLDAVFSRSDRAVLERAAALIGDDAIRRRTMDVVCHRAGLGEAHCSFTNQRPILLPNRPLDISGSDPLARAALRDAMAAEVELLMPWCDMAATFRALNHVLTEGAQLAYYLPWLPRVVEMRGAVNADDLAAVQFPTPRGYLARGASSARSRLRRALKEISERKIPTSYVPMTREQRDFCRAGDEPLAQLMMLNDSDAKPPEQASGMALLLVDFESLPYHSPANPIMADARFSKQ
jgi:hypothetical protein